MADQKISELTNITGANLADADEFVVVDVSADQTKAVTRSEFFKDTPDITTTGTVTADGDMTTKGTFAVNRTAAGYGAVEIGGASGGLIDLKAPFSDDYDARIIYNSGTDLRITTLAAGEPIRLDVGNTTRLTANNTGIDVTGNLTVTGTGDALLTVSSTGTGDADATLRLDSADTGESVLEFMHDGVLGARIEWFTDGNPDLNIATQAGTDGVIDFQPNNSLAVRIDKDGNVGIGDNAPAEKLSVQAADLGTTAGDSVDILSLRSDTSNVDRMLYTAERISTGTDWTTAAHRMQRKVDATLMGYMQFGSIHSDLITFGENATEYMRIDGSGALLHGTTTAGSAGAGDIVVNGGIYLGGAVAANKLDDYEEGTFTPAYSAGGSSTATYDTQDGKYTKVGNLVTVNIVLRATALGAMTGTVSITGMPFASNGFGSASVGYATNLALTAGTTVTGIVSGSGAISMREWNSTGGTSSITEANLGATAYMIMSATYKTNA